VFIRGCPDGRMSGMVMEMVKELMQPRAHVDINSTRARPSIIYENGRPTASPPRRLSTFRDGDGAVLAVHAPGHVV
jgi:hypothetical protein